MVLDLSSVFTDEGREMPVDCSFEMSSDDSFGSPVYVKGSVQNKTGIVSFTAVVTFRYDTVCARCDCDIRREMSFDIRHLLIKELNDSEDDDLFIVVPDLKLDIDALISEDIYLSLPPRFLCKEDCKGLCPTCGADLNNGDCGCVKQIDPRLSPLAELLNNPNLQ